MKYAVCHPHKKHKARGLCHSCYAKQWEKPAICNHPERPARARGLCGACYEAALKQEKPDYKARAAARNRMYYHRDRDLYLERERLRYQDQEGKRHWERAIARKYGVTPDWVQKQSEKQAGACAICLKPFSHETKRPAIDHCHETGKVRGLLCQMCNTALGCAEDRAELLREMAKYVEYHRGESEAGPCPNPTE